MSARESRQGIVSVTYDSKVQLLLRAVSCVAVMAAMFAAMSCSQSATPPLFVDDFNRPDTVTGLGEGWDMRGAYRREYTLPPASDGFIKDGKYTYAGDSIVYAVRQFPEIMRSAGTEGMWTKVRDGATTTIGVVLTANDRIISDMVHFTANREKWSLSTRRDSGEFIYIARGNFYPPLELDRSYRFEIRATDDSVVVDVPGHTETVMVSTAGLLGDRVFWEEYFARESGPAGTVFNFDKVWADS